MAPAVPQRAPLVCVVTDPVEDLQIRVEHQEMAIEELNRTVTFQARRLTELEAELASLRDRLRALQPSPLGDGDAQEIPPHY